MIYEYTDIFFTLVAYYYFFLSNQAMSTLSKAELFANELCDSTLP